ncbi:putative mRNA 3'-end processing factor [Anaeromyxobacter dehalogenans 2CP-1]|uniref:mRNA 3'-end processing factor n=1 Tax=Anaeromyxobacter dehalogenans (strain ATCC BAA-258 / DSM 21875 / 2CP-1) TaxID=455488 RepID=B8J7T9_ANAD2|nr:MBL fold metallo-hydrolase [Anaeromyxobacter dehalogenans]ACL63431.1 putative mRNA 3'-end processing factor [Anaeromyxobacter dehalogenans 2CP-1]
MRRPPIELHRGELKVTGSSLHLDATRRVECAFVSHAHGDHIGRHDRTIATAATLALMRHRLGEGKRRKTEHLPASYRSPFGLGELTLELFPAGHVLGSAQVRVTRNGVSLGYSGDLCTEPTHAAERAEVMGCDVLVIESTFGHPRYVFPPKDETLAAVRRFVDGALADGVTPVLLGYALGKAQEILKYLSDLGYACRAHPVVHAVNKVYEAHGVALPNVRPLGPEGAGMDEVVVCPPHLARSPAMRGLRKRRTAILTGWAIDGGRFFRGVDAAFPLSDHADFPSLVRYARATGAGRVFTVHGHEDALAAALRKEGIRAEPLREHMQLELI